MGSIINIHDYLAKLDKEPDREDETNINSSEADILDFKDVDPDMRQFEEARAKSVDDLLNTPAAMSDLQRRLINTATIFTKDYIAEFKIPANVLLDIVVSDGLRAVVEKIDNQKNKRYRKILDDLLAHAKKR